MIDASNAEYMSRSRRELISLVHDTKTLSQPILILVSTDNISSEKEEADLMAECDFQEMIAEVRSPLFIRKKGALLYLPIHPHPIALWKVFNGSQRKWRRNISYLSNFQLLTFKFMLGVVLTPFDSQY